MVMFTVEHLCILTEDVAIRVNLHQRFSDEFFMHQILRSRVIIVRGFPTFEQFCNSRMIPISQLFRRNSLTYGFDFDGCAMLIGTTHEQDIITLKPVISGCDVGG
jgi:hypothetical protein